VRGTARTPLPFPLPSSSRVRAESLPKSAQEEAAVLPPFPLFFSFPFLFLPQRRRNSHPRARPGPFLLPFPFPFLQDLRTRFSELVVHCDPAVLPSSLPLRKKEETVPLFPPPPFLRLDVQRAEGRT